jgi:hypothetical protein
LKSIDPSKGQKEGMLTSLRKDPEVREAQGEQVDQRQHNQSAIFSTRNSL